MADNVRIHSWRHKVTKEWKTTSPRDWSKVGLLRIQYDKPKGGHGYFFIKAIPAKPNQTNRQQTEFIESLLPRFLDPYLARNG